MHSPTAIMKFMLRDANTCLRTRCIWGDFTTAVMPSARQKHISARPMAAKHVAIPAIPAKTRPFYKPLIAFVMNGKLKMFSFTKTYLPEFLIYLTLCFTGCREEASQFNSGNPSTNTLRCSGDSSCQACSACKYCKLCKAGANCGVCDIASKSRSKIKVNEPAIKEQCHAITKKGTSCKRPIKNGIYCWQHQRYHR